MTTTVKVKNYSGDVTETKALAIWAEKDADGNVFYKMELQNEITRAALSFIYDKQEALAELIRAADKILTEQTVKLLSKGE